MQDYTLGQLEQNAKLRARQLCKTLSQLGPSFVKIGQALSSRPDLLPQIYLEVRHHNAHAAMLPCTQASWRSLRIFTKLLSSPHHAWMPAVSSLYPQQKRHLVARPECNIIRQVVSVLNGSLRLQCFADTV